MPTNCLNVFDHFVGLELKELTCSCKLAYQLKGQSRSKYLDKPMVNYFLLLQNYVNRLSLIFNIV